MDKKDYQNHNPIIGGNICRMREAQHLKEVDVVAQLQLRGIMISPGAYCHVEKGRNNSSVEMLDALTDIFKCGYSDFFRPLPSQSDIIMD